VGVPVLGGGGGPPPKTWEGVPPSPPSYSTEGSNEQKKMKNIHFLSGYGVSTGSSVFSYQPDQPLLL